MNEVTPEEIKAISTALNRDLRLGLVNATVYPDVVEAARLLEKLINE